jgi:transposase
VDAAVLWISPAGGQHKQAMSRTLGRLNTKLHAFVDGECILTAGTAVDVVHAPALLEGLEANKVILDKAYDSDALRELIIGQGMKACIPPRKGCLAPSAYDKELYK